VSPRVFYPTDDKYSIFFLKFIILISIAGLALKNMSISRKKRAIWKREISKLKPIYMLTSDLLQAREAMANAV